MAANILELSGVTKNYAAAEGTTELPILRGLDLTLVAGESLAVIGPSGSGKSTLLNIIGTLDQPSAGKMLLDGEDVTHLDEKALARVRARKIGFIFQSHHLLPQCTVLENVLVPTLAADDAGLKATAPDRARKLLEGVGLGHRLAHRPGQLSGGERQRVAVIRALINQPKLLLADEPTGALDRASAQNLAEILVRLNQEEKVTLVLVTHALDHAAKMSRLLELRDGTLQSIPSAARNIS